MGNKLANIVILFFIGLWGMNLQAQCSNNFTQPELYFDGTQLQTQYAVLDNPLCTSNVYTYGLIPNWISISYDGPLKRFVVTCNINPSNSLSIEVPITTINGSSSGIIGSIRINQSCGPNCVNWYPDTDGDTYGDYNGNPVYAHTQPFPGAVTNNLDYCPNEYSLQYNGCIEPFENSINWISTKTYRIDGQLNSRSRQYYNDLGRPTQSQSYNTKTHKMWAQQIFYDYQGRPALSTLSAPITPSVNGVFFDYKGDFVRIGTGYTTPLTTADFDNANPEVPPVIGDFANTLGWYYSNSNTSEPYQDITDRPYSRSIYSTLNPGTVLKTVGGNPINNEWKQSYTFSMKAGQELVQAGAFNDMSYDSANRKIIKTVSRDVHGVENVVFTDTDGKTLAVARSGGTAIRNSTVIMGTQGHIDIHIPQYATGFTISKPSNITIDVYNLISETVVTAATSTLANGFYRVSVTNMDAYVEGDVSVTYKENYYDYSINLYNDIGQLTSSKQPLNQLETTYEYNVLGQLIRTTSPDEGTAEFVYRGDGQLRFSQSDKQKDPNDDGNFSDAEYSYTNYDALGRPIESGVVSGAFSINMDGDMANTFSGVRSEQHFTSYDYLEAPDLTFLASVNGNYGTPKFLASNVAKTENREDGINLTTATYYSYDLYGRVQWLVQNIVGLGIKTIDYEYDPITGQVLKVDYQKNDGNERFIHRYTYDTDDYSLIKVETSMDDSNFTTHADYTYYETGALKNIVLAGGLQQTDYVYNLAGQLKAINHPTLNASNDPGGNANDMFGMMIDYHSDDYKRPVPNITTPNYGTNQYNGNIKGIRWNTEQASANEAIYSYTYDRNNWLIAADYGSYTETNGNANTNYIEDSNVYSSSANVTQTAAISVTLKPGFHAPQGSNYLATIAPVGNFDSGNSDYDVTNITYDANGNIQSLKRNKNTEANSNDMDDLNYEYRMDKPNQLLRVEDVYGSVGVGDIDDQTTANNGNNYVYNVIGQLVENHKEDLGYHYNTSGLVTEVYKFSNNDPIVKFVYDDKNKRVKKESYANGSLAKTTYYVRDASGHPQAIYEQMAGNSIDLKEHPIYGNGRVGVFSRTASNNGSAVYQLTDHLGNVRAVIQSDGINAIAIVKTDYYPFGMPMPNHNNLQGGYRYGYQGEYAEKEPEMPGVNSFELRLWDSRIGRWLSPDPYGQFNSPYLGMGNNPINQVDPDGGCSKNPSDPNYDPNCTELDEVVLTGSCAPNCYKGVVGTSETSYDAYYSSDDQYAIDFPEFAAIPRSKWDSHWNKKYKNAHLDLEIELARKRAAERLRAFILRLKFALYDTGVLDYANTYLQFAAGNSAMSNFTVKALGNNTFTYRSILSRNVSIFRAPKAGTLDDIMQNGFNKSDHLLGNRSIHFGEKSVAAEYARTGAYDSYLIRVRVTRSFAKKHASRYLDGSGRIEYIIPVETIDQLNKFRRSVIGPFW